MVAGVNPSVLWKFHSQWSWKWPLFSTWSYSICTENYPICERRTVNVREVRRLRLSHYFPIWVPSYVQEVRWRTRFWFANKQGKPPVAHSLLVLWVSVSQISQKVSQKQSDCVTPLIVIGHCIPFNGPSTDLCWRTGTQPPILSGAPSLKLFRTIASELRVAK
jgi:hypothetical protein